MMVNRSIPPIRQNVHLGRSKLLHVTAILRHGARTPWSSSMSCWDGYWESDAGSWDCELTTWLASYSPKQDYSDKNNDNEIKNNTMFVFEKKYDALTYPQRNELNGTCQRGQLLLQGYEQELQNGKFLRDAYVLTKESTTTKEQDARLMLFDLTEDKIRPYEYPYLRYRTDDDQRTLMSGQIVLRGLFGEEIVDYTRIHDGQPPVIPLHVADRSRDILDPNQNICPRLKTLQQIALKSSDFQAFNHSDENKILRKFIQSELGTLDLSLDCLMTTICTDRTLPPAIGTYQPSSHFRKLHPGHTHSHSTCKHHSRNLHAGHHHDDNGDDDDDDEDDGDDDDESSTDENYRICKKYGDHLFDRIVKTQTKAAVFPQVYNNSEFSKVAMGPLWAEILDILSPITNSKTTHSAMPTNKLHLISGHDSTIIPLLASIGVWSMENDNDNSFDWPPYATMVLLELHQLQEGESDSKVYSSPFAIRLLYNGNVLQGLLKSFATRDRNCFDDATMNEADYRPSALAPDSLEGNASTTSGIIIMILFVALLSAGIGGYITYCCMEAKRSPRYNTVVGDFSEAERKYPNDSADLDTPAMLVL
jgi:Histidine phosphatase superfamily (branch 2)